MKRDQLIDAAVRAVRRTGADASMEEIAREAGITKPILYRHFGDREGLRRAVGERFAATLVGRLRRALASSGSPRRMLSATVDAYLGFVERDPNVYRFVLQRAQVGEAAGFVRRIVGDIATVIGEALRAEGRDSAAAEPWAYGLVGMVHLAGDWWIEQRSMPRARLVEYLTALVWDGLSAAVPDAGVRLVQTARR